MPVYQEIDFAPPSFAELTAGPATTPGYRDAILALGPTAYWTLDETSGGSFADLTGNHPLTITGSVTLGGAQANRSAPGASARLVDGEAVSSGPVLPASASARFTLLAWLRREGSMSQTGEAFGQFSNPDPGRMVIRLMPGGGVRYRVVADSAVDTPAGMVGADWAQLAIVRDGPALTIYINGLPAVSVANQLSPIAATGFTIGRVVATVDVTVDEVAVVPEALSAEQLAVLYRLAASLPGPAPGI